jgi:hypothetical protein
MRETERYAPTITYVRVGDMFPLYGNINGVIVGSFDGKVLAKIANNSNLVEVTGVTLQN